MLGYGRSVYWNDKHGQRGRFSEYSGGILVESRLLLKNGCTHCNWDHEKILKKINQKANKVNEIDGINLANKLGNILVVNTILLGALCGIQEHPLTRKSMEKAISSRLKQKYVAINLEAFKIGIEQVKLG